MPNETCTVPIFPLENVVLFPSVQVPLHIFEPRYRQMTEAVLAGNRRIAMVVVRPEHDRDMRGNPPVFDICCEGEIERCDKLPDGRFNLLLTGTRRLRILEEEDTSDTQLYRVARAEVLEDPYPEQDRDHVTTQRGGILSMMRDLIARIAPDRVAIFEEQGFVDVDDATFVNALAQSLDFAPSEKQALLEAASVRERYEGMANLLRFRLAELAPGASAGPERMQ